MAERQTPTDSAFNEGPLRTNIQEVKNKLGGEEAAKAAEAFRDGINETVGLMASELNERYRPSFEELLGVQVDRLYVYQDTPQLLILQNAFLEEWLKKPEERDIKTILRNFVEQHADLQKKDEATFNKYYIPLLQLYFHLIGSEKKLKREEMREKRKVAKKFLRSLFELSTDDDRQSMLPIDGDGAIGYVAASAVTAIASVSDKIEISSQEAFEAATTIQKGAPAVKVGLGAPVIVGPEEEEEDDDDDDDDATHVMKNPFIIDPPEQRLPITGSEEDDDETLVAPNGLRVAATMLVQPGAQPVALSVQAMAAAAAQVAKNSGQEARVKKIAPFDAAATRVLPRVVVPQRPGSDADITPTGNVIPNRPNNSFLSEKAKNIVAGCAIVVATGAIAYLIYSSKGGATTSTSSIPAQSTLTTSTFNPTAASPNSSSTVDAGTNAGVDAGADAATDGGTQEVKHTKNKEFPLDIKK